MDSSISCFPVKHMLLRYYVAHLYQQGLAPSSVCSHLSAINFINQAMGGLDLFQDFLLSRMLCGYRKSYQSTPDQRLPITPSILQRLCEANNIIATSPYHQSLFQSMFLLAFHGFLRVGEITVPFPNIPNPNLLQLSNLSLSHSTKSVSITFTHYKHSTTPCTINISFKSPPFSLYHSIIQYLVLRGTAPGPLFLDQKAPISRSLFTSHLTRCLQKANLDTRRYKSHSFRIGAATTAINQGFTYPQVQEMGRWKSSAFKKYIRIQSFHI